jgi:hypothetical protein
LSRDRAAVESTLFAEATDKLNGFVAIVLADGGFEVNVSYYLGWI